MTSHEESVLAGRAILGDPYWNGGMAVCGRTQDICTPLSEVAGSICRNCGHPISWHRKEAPMSDEQKVMNEAPNDELDAIDLEITPHITFSGQLSPSLLADLDVRPGRVILLDGDPSTLDEIMANPSYTVHVDRAYDADFRVTVRDLAGHKPPFDHTQLNVLLDEVYAKGGSCDFAYVTLEFARQHGLIGPWHYAWLKVGRWFRCL